MAEGSKPSVLIVTRNLPPLWGGMEQLNWHMVDELAQEAIVRVVGPSGSGEGICPGVEMLEVPLRPLPRFLLGAFGKAMKSARRSRPDVVLAGSGLTAPIAWLAARVSGAKSVVYVHGLDVAIANVLYRCFWIPVMRRMDCVIANSRATAQLAQQAGIHPAKIRIVNPGVSLPNRPIDMDAAARLREEKQWGARSLLLSVGRLTSRKGLREFVEDVLPKIVSRCPDVLLLVVGEAPANSLHAAIQTTESIRLAASNAGVAGNLEFLGVITDRDRLATIYETADVHVFPVRSIPNDPEGFGMVAIEAAAHGLPTVAYATGGVVDAVAEGVSGYLLTPGDSAAFADTVEHLLKQRLPDKAIRTFAKRFDWEHFGNQIRQALFGGFAR
jgi:phosphatidyl-myo-inositol dimannoside synthase